MYVFNVDRGGTFTDFYVQEVEGMTVMHEWSFKVPSVSAEGEGPIVGIRKFLIEQKCMEVDGQKIPIEKVKCINLGTTIATNALLERKGVKNAIIMSEGFSDLLEIKHQARPNIFDLSCSFPPPITQNTYSCQGRIYRSELESQQLQPIKQRVFYSHPQNEELEAIYKDIISQEIESVGISFCNSYLYGEGEKDVQAFFLKKGIKNVQIGSKYASSGYLKRTETASLDAYLNPIMKQYFQTLIQNFHNAEHLILNVMKSDGGFTDYQNAHASQLLLSGPAGGLIGYARMANQFETLCQCEIKNMMGLDMGGTSTDLSKVMDRQISINYQFGVEGIEICTPHLEIQTIAAGGGSKLTFFNGMLKVGPESVGSNPGPVCYGVGEDLALTDANLILNRLDPRYFPKVFGKHHDEGLNIELSIKAFSKLYEEVNCERKEIDQVKSIYELAEGYVEIANEAMARSGRKILTMGKPDALVVFGSAAGQHCCDIGQKLGVQNIIIHKYSGVLSAFGLSKAYRTQQYKIYLGMIVDKATFNYEEFSHQLQEKEKQQLEMPTDGFDEVRKEIIIGYVGTNFNLIVKLDKNMLHHFQARHQEESGFALPSSRFRIEYLRYTFIKFPPEFQRGKRNSESQDPKKFLLEQTDVFLKGRFLSVPKYDFSEMLNCQIKGPAILLSRTSSILVEEDWTANIVQQNIHLKKMKAHEKLEMMNPLNQKCDPIKLTLYSTRLMGIAEQMGKVLQKTSISTNIKERLDFSCGIFDWDGALLANAPHLPVHLGSMETTVLEQIKRGIKPGDVILSNHPEAGGSHLPDLTVITCFQIGEGKNFYVASRGHHADIGGITPGSMPPFSKSLSEEGVPIEKFELVVNGHFQEEQTKLLFKESRRVNENVSDLLAQISANELGVKLLKTLVKEYGLPEFSLYVKYICQNACQSVQNMLYNFSSSNGFPLVHSIQAREYMDDGTPLSLTLTINRQIKKAIFDFTGTGPEVKGNTNAPKAITKSAILYCLRSLIQNQIPLNSGCLKPVQILIPENSILSPSPNAAVVGGNVETSQKLVDLILKPFKYVACSQGTMNNFLFGNQTISYYETICGGSGAGSEFPGKTVQCHMTNTRITDPEHLQNYYPVVLTQFSKRRHSGGKGKNHGGDGAIREFLFLEPMEVSILSERRVYPPYGLKGGEEGKVGENWLFNQQGKVNLGGKNCFKVQKYDIVRIETPGGGGYGQKIQQSQ